MSEEENKNKSKKKEKKRKKEGKNKNSQNIKHELKKQIYPNIVIIIRD